MADNNKDIVKITAKDGSVYYIYDMDAPRISDLDNYLSLSGGTIDGNLEVTGETRLNNVNIADVEWIPVDQGIDNVLIHSNEGDIAKRSTDKLLEDIGGISYSVDDEHGVLSFKIGKN